MGKIAFKATTLYNNNNNLYRIAGKKMFLEVPRMHIRTYIIFEINIYIQVLGIRKKILCSESVSLISQNTEKFI